MTSRSFKLLKTGDIVQNIISKSNYIVVGNKIPLEPITQITKDRIYNRYGEFNVIMKAKKEKK